MFGLSTIKLAIIAGTVAAVLAIGGWVVHAIKDSAIQGERARVEDANRVSEEKADAGQATFDDCIRAGRMWDRARGVCLRAGQ